MTTKRNLTEIKRAPLQTVLAGIDSNDPEESQRAGLRLCRQAAEFGISVRDYLQLAVDVPNSTIELEGGRKHNPFRLGEGRFADGYQAALLHLNLPARNDFSQGIMLQAAADSFSMRPGSRVLFPEVIDDMLQWATRQDQLETTQGLIAQSRTIRGTELITEAIFDDQGNLGSSMIAEFANIPVQTIKSSERSVRFYKLGSAIRTSYEFNRRVSLDVLTPYANRIARKLEIDKVTHAVSMLINGDGVHSAAPVVGASAYKNWDVTGSRSLKDNYPALMDFLVQRSKNGTPVDTLVGNYDTLLELFLMFTPVVGNKSLSEHLQDKGAPAISMMLPVMTGVKFHLSSAMPANKLVAFSQGDTLEELREADSQISESEVAIKNQSITYVKTETMGYRLVYGDTRTVLDLGA